MRGGFIYSLLVWLSCGLNVLTGGHPYQSFSVRQYLRSVDGKWHLVWFIDGLFAPIEYNHCERSFYRALERHRTVYTLKS